MVTCNCNKCTRKNILQFGKRHGMTVECVCYFIFIIIFIVMAVTSRGWQSDVYFASKGLSGHIIGSDHGAHPIFVSPTEFEFEWDQINSVEALWKYLKDILIPVVLNEDGYDAATNRYTYKYFQTILGGMRIRQYRQSETERCYRQDVEFQCYHTDDAEDKSTISIVDENDASNNFVAEWKSTSENKEAPYLIGVHRSYPGSGQVVILPLDRAEALQKLNLLEANNFFDGGTRLISVDFSFYNPSTNLHVVCRLWFETLEAGYIEEHYHINAWEFLRNQDHALRIVELLFVIFLAGWTLVLIFKIYACCKHETIKFTRWDQMDCISIFFYWLFVAFEVVQYFDETQWTNFVSVDEFESLQFSEYWLQLENYCLMIDGVFLFVRLFKYLKGSDRLSFMILLFTDAAVDIIIIFVSLSFILLSFALSGFLFLSGNLEEFRTIWLSIISMIRSVVDPMDYHEFARNHPIAGTVFYIIWNLIILLVLINIFIAVISQSYVKIQEQRNDEEDEMTMKEILSGWKDKMVVGMVAQEEATKKKKKVIQYVGGGNEITVKRVRDEFDKLLDEHNADEIKKDKLVKLFEKVLQLDENEFPKSKRARRILRKAWKSGLLYEVAMKEKNQIMEEEEDEDEEKELLYPRRKGILNEDFADRDRIIEFAQSNEAITNISKRNWREFTVSERAGIIIEYFGGDESADWRIYSAYAPSQRKLFNKYFVHTLTAQSKEEVKENDTEQVEEKYQDAEDNEQQINEDEEEYEYEEDTEQIQVSFDDEDQNGEYYDETPSHTENEDDVYHVFTTDDS